MATKPAKTLDTFPNPHPARDYIIVIDCPEFTCLCPKTGQPDFAHLSIEYVPDQLCVELKSLKLYVWSYRSEGHFHEDVTNRILNDLVAATHPRYMSLRAKFNVRGGIYTTVEVEHRQPGWNAPEPKPDGLPRENQALPGKPAAAEVKAPPATAVIAAKPTAAATPVPTPPPAPAPESSATASATTPTNERFRMLRRNRRGAAAADTPATTPEEPIAPAVPAATPPPLVRQAPPERRDLIYIGIDLGTTGCRIIAINSQGRLQAQKEAPIPAPLRTGEQVTQDPNMWWRAVTGCLQSLFKEIDPKRVHTIAVDGTSATLLLCDDKGTPTMPAILYNDQRAEEQAKKIAALSDSEGGAQGASSSLAKLLWLHEKKIDKNAKYFLHQADWISNHFTGIYGHSDYNNCLKLGYDAEKMAWPKWMNKLGIDMARLPEVHTPGDFLGIVSEAMCKTFGLSPDTRVVAGTTDGVAAFLAAGSMNTGEGVTALGTTLVLKLLSNKPVFAPEYGVYSHRLGKYWLAGGASNSGGAVLLQYFKEAQMREMSALLDPENLTELNYYPLPNTGERFPVNNPDMEPQLEPLPGDSIIFFQGMLEGIARIEAKGYKLLQQLGAPALTLVRTTGSGAQNAAWTRIREKILNVKIEKTRSDQSAYGTALLAAGLAVKDFQ